MVLKWRSTPRALEAADEMPVERPEILQLRLFGHRLLQAALREAALPGGGGRADCLGGLSLAHGQQPGGGGKPAAQGLQARGQGIGGLPCAHQRKV
jgi:hypothetical protein